MLETCASNDITPDQYSSPRASLRTDSNKASA
jgi:hypothetical protein